jgi:hypothetical protein
MFAPYTGSSDDRNRTSSPCAPFSLVVLQASDSLRVCYSPYYYGYLYPIEK